MGKVKELMTNAMDRRQKETSCSVDEAYNWAEKQDLDFLIKYVEEWRAESNNKNWPQTLDTYFFASSCGVVGDDEYYSSSYVDASRQSIGNFFKTKEEAEFALEKLKVYKELRDLSDDDRNWDSPATPHYAIMYNAANNVLYVDAWSVNKMMNGVYFKTRDSATAAINKVGHERIIKYLFR